MYIYAETCIGASDFRGLGPGILPVLEINYKGQVLHHVCLHLKVPGRLSDLNALLTRKFT